MLQKTKKNLQSKKIVCLLFVLILFAGLVGVPIIGPDASASSSEDDLSRQVVRAEKSVLRDGAPVAPKNDPANDHPYNYILTATATHTLTVEYRFEDPQGLNNPEVVKKTQYADLQHGKTLSQNEIDFTELLPPEASSLTTSAKYSKYELTNWYISTHRDFTANTPIYEDITLIYTYGPPANENQVNLQTEVSLEVIAADSFGHNSFQTLKDANAKVFAQLYQATTPFGAGAIPIGNQIEINDWDSIESNNFELLFANMERKDASGNPYYYQIRFTEQDLPECYSLPEDSQWVISTYYDSYDPDTIYFAPQGGTMGESFSMNVLTRIITVAIADTYTGATLPGPMNGLPYVEYTILHGEIIPVDKPIPAPVYDDATYDPPNLQGVTGEPASGFTNGGLPVEKDMVATFTVTPNSYENEVDVEANIQFAGFFSNASLQNTDDAFHDDVEIKLILAQKLGDTIQYITQIISIDETYKSGSYTFEDIPRYVEDLNTGEKTFYEYQLSQAFVEGKETKVNGSVCYGLVESEWAIPENTHYTIGLENTPVVHWLRAEFYERVDGELQDLHPDVIPYAFANAYDGGITTDGSVMMQVLHGSMVDIASPEILGKNADVARFTNAETPVIANSSTRFVYDFGADVLIDIEATIGWDYYDSDDLGNYYRDNNVDMAGVSLEVDLYGRIIGSSEEVLINTQSVNFTGAVSNNEYILLTDVPRTDAQGKVYEYQLRLRQIGNLPTHNGVIAFSLENSEWVVSTQADSETKRLYMQAINPQVRYAAVLRCLNGDENNSVIDSQQYMMLAGSSTGSYNNFDWDWFVSSKDLVDFNRIYGTSFDDVSGEPQSVTNIDEDKTIDFVFTDSNALNKEAKVPMPKSTPIPEESAPTESPEPSIDRQEVPLPEPTSSIIEEQPPVETSEIVESSSPINMGIEDEANTVGAPILAMAGGVPKINSSYYDEVFGLYLVGNESCYNITETGPGEYTFTMVNGGTIDVYIAHEEIIPTKRSENPYPTVPYSFTLTEKGQPLGEHSVQLDYGKVITKSGENVGLSVGFTTPMSGENGHYVTFDSNLPPAADLQILKHEAGNEDTRLADIVFDVKIKEGSAYVPYLKDLTTNENGLIEIKKALIVGEYQLVETKAKDGYEIEKTPIDFEVLPAQTADGAASIVLKVANKKVAEPLPSPTDDTQPPTGGPSSSSGTGAKTGDSNGALLFIILSMMAIAVMGVVWILSRRKVSKK